MRSVSVPADVITYSASISACEKGQQWQCALGLLESMRSVSVPANVITYSASISACEKGQQWQCALRLLESMQSASVPADVITYSASISACEWGACNSDILSDLLRLIWGDDIRLSCSTTTGVLTAKLQRPIFNSGIAMLGRMAETSGDGY